MIYFITTLFNNYPLYIPFRNLAGDNREAEDRDGQILTVPELFAKLYLTPPPSKHQTKNNLSKPAKDNVVKVVKKKVRGRKLDTERMDKAKKCLFRETKVPFVSKIQVRSLVPFLRSSVCFGLLAKSAFNNFSLS